MADLFQVPLWSSLWTGIWESFDPIPIGNIATLDLPLLINLQATDLTYNASITRATAGTVVDWEGIVRTCLSGEARFQGARRVENLVTQSNAMLTSPWVTYGAGQTESIDTTEYPAAEGVTPQSYKITSSGGFQGRQQVNILTAGKKYTCSVWIKGSSGGEIVLINDGAGSGGTFTVTNEWKRYSQSWTSANANLAILLNDSGKTVWFAGVQCELTEGQASSAPANYLASETDYGANVDDVKYFDTENGNTVSSNVVTEATGSLLTTLDGLLIEEASTNLFTYSDDITNWTTGGSPTVHDYQSFTATIQNDAVLIATATTAAQSYTISFRAKGTSVDALIHVNHNGSATGNTQTIGLTTAWADYKLTVLGEAASGNVSFGIIDTRASGWDKIWVENFQVENKAYKTSLVPTAGSSATRNADDVTATWPINLVNDFISSCEWTPSNDEPIVIWDSGDIYLEYDGTDIIFNKTAVTATKTTTVVAGIVYDLKCRVSSSNGIDVWVDSTKGTGDADINDATPVANLSIGHDDAVANHSNGTIKNIRVYEGDLSDDEVFDLDPVYLVDSSGKILVDNAGLKLKE